MEDLKNEIEQLKFTLQRDKKRIKKEKPYKIIKKETRFQFYIRRIRDKINFFLYKIGLYY